MKISKFDAAAKTVVRVIVCAAILLVFFRNSFPSLEEAIVLESVPVPASDPAETEEYSPDDDPYSSGSSAQSENSSYPEPSGESSTSEPSTVSQTELNAGSTSDVGSSSSSLPESSDNQSTSASSEQPPEQQSDPETDPPIRGKININTATSAQLQSLSGIGEVKANAIIAYREQHGAFSTVDELTNVSGIGEKTLEKIRAEITV